MKRALVAVLAVLSLTGGASAAEDNPDHVKVEVTAAGVAFPAVADLSTLVFYFDPPGNGDPEKPPPQRAGAPFSLVHGLPSCFGIDLVIEGAEIEPWIAAMEKSVATPGDKKPPETSFTWGEESFLSYEGVIRRLATKYTLFWPDGEPARATVSMRVQPRASPSSQRHPAGDCV